MCQRFWERRKRDAWYNPIKKFVAFKCSFHVKALLVWWYQRTHKEVSTIELQICIGIYVDKKPLSRSHWLYLKKLRILCLFWLDKECSLISRSSNHDQMIKKVKSTESNSPKELQMAMVLKAPPASIILYI